MTLITQINAPRKSPLKITAWIKSNLWRKNVPRAVGFVLKVNEKIPVSTYKLYTISSSIL